MGIGFLQFWDYHHIEYQNEENITYQNKICALGKSNRKPIPQNNYFIRESQSSTLLVFFSSFHKNTRNDWQFIY